MADQSRGRKAVFTGVGAAMALAATFIATFEGKSNEAYYDLIGVKTICYGHAQGVRPGDFKSDAECATLLFAEISRLKTILRNEGNPKLTLKQRAAFVSWMYNVGEGNFRRSTLRKYLQQGNVYEACRQLLRWDRAAGKRIPGLTRRRQAEYALCVSEL